MLRKMVPEDYDALTALWYACKGMGLNNIDDSRDGIARFLARNPETCFVAEEEGAVVGAILVGSDGRRGYVYHLAVVPAFRRRGIASALVAAGMNALKELGIAKAALVVFSHNAEGNAFWESRDFTLRTDLSYRNKSLVEIVRMDT